MNKIIEPLFTICVIIELILLSQITYRFIQKKNIKIISYIIMIFTLLVFFACCYLLYKQFPVKINDAIIYCK